MNDMMMAKKVIPAIVSISYDRLLRIIAYLNDYNDEGPSDEAWKSDQLQADIEFLKAIKEG
jgi:hypothetical protein